MELYLAHLDLEALRDLSVRTRGVPETLPDEAAAKSIWLRDRTHWKFVHNQRKGYHNP